MEATIFLPIGMGLIVVGAGLGIGRFAAAALPDVLPQVPSKPTQKLKNILPHNYSSIVSEVKNGWSTVPSSYW